MRGGKKNSKIYCFFLFFAVFLQTSFFLFPEAKEYFTSNELAMALEKINPIEKDLHPYVVTVEWKDGKKERVLFYYGEIKKRDVSYFAGRVLIKRELYSNKGRERTIFYNSNEKIREIWYYNEELVEKKEVYLYKDGNLEEVTTFDEEGNVLKQMYYKRDLKGRLQWVELVEEEGRKRSGYVYSDKEIIAERHVKREKSEDIFYYDPSGRKLKIISFREGKKVEETDFSYPSANTTIKETQHYVENIHITEIIENERLVEKTTRKNGNFNELIRWEYDREDNVSLKFRRSSGMRERWVYRYTNNNVLIEEVYSVNENTRKIIQYGEEDRRTEILYRNGTPFLEVYYQGTEKEGEQLLPSVGNGEN